METLKNGTEAIGARTKVKVVKNKVAPPFKEAEFDIMYGKGISKTGELIDAAVKLDIVEKSGSWFSYCGEKIGQGRDKAKDFLAQNPEVAEEVEEKIKEAMKTVAEKKSAPSPTVPTEKSEPAAAAPSRRVNLSVTADDFEDDEDI